MDPKEKDSFRFGVFVGMFIGWFSFSGFLHLLLLAKRLSEAGQ